MSTDLIERWSTAAQAYLDGDLRTYARLAHHTADYTLIPPNGGDPRHGFDGSEEAVAWTARTFRGGSVDLEVFRSYVEGDLAVLVAVERQHARSASCRARSGRCGSPWCSGAKTGSGGWCTGTPTRSRGRSSRSSSPRWREASTP